MAHSFITDAVCTRRNALNRDKEPAAATQHTPNMFQSDMGSSERIYCQEIAARGC